ncbi:MAG: outer membrane beta-barrel protein, partial [Leeuwenhoekiella sp.]
IKKDTLEFNAASFQTRPDANLEDLLKKLPGAEVDSDGNITVNGKPVSRILVNGKEFFGDDPQIATKNLPKEIINKIQVTDTKTKSEEFTGKAGDPDDKTINITIKEDKNKGYFARATAGGGTDDRYELSAIGNIFKDDMRLSVLASSNNINSTGFDFDDVYGMMGRNGADAVYGGNRGGITKSETAGFNFTDEWQKKYELNTDYFFGRNDTQTRTSTQRENILPDSRYYTNSESSNNVINDSHRGNARFEVEFDTLTRLSISPRINANFANNTSNNFSESLDEDRNIINNSQTSNREEVKSVNLDYGMDFIKRFGSRGAFIRAEFDYSNDTQENDNFYYSESNFYDVPRTELQDQYINDDEKENQYAVELEQRSVLAKNLFLDLSYDFSSSKSTNERDVYDADNSGAYTAFNDTLSNNFEVRTFKNTPNVGLNYEGEAWRINTSVGLLNTHLENTNFLQQTSFDNTYNNLYLRSRIRYEIERSKSIYFDYRTNANTPSIRQLQPVIDRTNPLNIVVGNPALRPEYSHDIRGGFRNFDFSTRSGVWSYFSLNFTNNRVVSVTTLDTDLVRTTTYTNVNGSMNASVGGSYSKSYKKDAVEFRYSFDLNGSYNKNVGFTNGVLYNSDQYSLNPSVRFTYAIDEYFELNPNYRLSFNDTRYDINPDRNADFINHTVGFEATTYWPKHVVFGNDITYNYYGNVSAGFDNSSILWNMSLGYQFLKDNATLKVKVYDVLDQNIDTRRSTGDDYVQDTNSLILQQYAMLSFTYKLSNFGGKAAPDGNGGGRRGYRRH